MRIAVLQFNPQIGDIAHNLKRAELILQRANPQNIDLLVLPEMAFSGYNFPSLPAISFHLEPTAAGPSTVWARALSRRHRCHVLLGYPELSTPSKTPHNSAILLSPAGDVLANYRKHHLYTTDTTWAVPGPSFHFSVAPAPLGPTALGICMDLNPKDFVAPFDAYEFANHLLNTQARLALVPMAWLTQEPAETLDTMAQVPDAETLSYWVRRLQPVIDQGPTCREGELVVVCANRTGVEGAAVYAGTSVVLGIERGSVKVYGCLGRGVEDLLVVDVPDAAAAGLGVDLAANGR